MIMDISIDLSHSVLLATALLLLILGGVESNPGPSSVSGHVTLGLLNARSAVHEAPLLHDAIAEYKLDMLVVTETWMKSTNHPAINHDNAPTGYGCIDSMIAMSLTTSS